MTLLQNRFDNNQADDEGGATIWLNKPFINKNLPKEDKEIVEEADEFEIDTNDGPESDDQDDEDVTPVDDGSSSLVDDFDLNGDEIIGEGGNIFIDNNATQ